MMEYTIKDYIDGFLYLCIMLSPFLAILGGLLLFCISQFYGEDKFPFSLITYLINKLNKKIKELEDKENEEKKKK